MATVIEFRNFADACTRLAQSAETETSKTALLAMAERWSRIAAQAERVRQLVREADAVFQAPEAETEKPKVRVRTADKAPQPAPV